MQKAKMTQKCLNPFCIRIHVELRDLIVNKKTRVLNTYPQISAPDPSQFSTSWQATTGWRLARTDTHIDISEKVYRPKRAYCLFGVDKIIFFYFHFFA